MKRAGRRTGVPRSVLPPHRFELLVSPSPTPLYVPQQPQAHSPKQWFLRLQPLFPLLLALAFPTQKTRPAPIHIASTNECATT